MASEKNNDSNLLAEAIGKVHAEAFEKTADLLRNERVDTTNENVRARLVQHQDDVTADVREVLKGT